MPEILLLVLNPVTFFSGAGGLETIFPRLPCHLGFMRFGRQSTRRSTSRWKMLNFLWLLSKLPLVLPAAANGYLLFLYFLISPTSRSLPHSKSYISRMFLRLHPPAKNPGVVSLFLTKSWLMETLALRVCVLGQQHHLGAC